MSKPQKDDFEAVRSVIDALTGFDSVDQERILRWAREKLGLDPQPLSPALVPTFATHTPIHHPAPGVPGTSESSTDIKSFVQAKAPTSDNQFVAVVAYYYRFQAPIEARKEAITAEDVLEACRLTGRPRPNRVAQTMVNAHGQGLLDRAEGRGSYAINTVGENLVAITLPAGGAAGATTPSSRRPVRKNNGGRTSKKATKKTKKR